MLGTIARYVGTIADGSSDHEIISAVAKSLLEDSTGAGRSVEAIPLGQSLRDDMDRFTRAVSKSQDYSLGGESARRLRNSVVNVLHSAKVEFQSRIPRAIQERDVIILNTDAELQLTHRDRYFDEWALIGPKILLVAIEEFYHHQILQGQTWEALPLVVPLVLFPSTDILVAAAKTDPFAQFTFHGLSPRDMKRKLYGVDDLRFLKEDELQTRAIDYITSSSCRGIYRHLPDARIFLRSLSWDLEHRPASTT